MEVMQSLCLYTAHNQTLNADATFLSQHDVNPLISKYFENNHLVTGLNLKKKDISLSGRCTMPFKAQRERLIGTVAQSEGIIGLWVFARVT